MRYPVLFVEGRFGDAVASIVKTRWDNVDVRPFAASRGSFDALVAAASFVGVAAWRRYVEASEELDGACARHGVRWSGCVLEGKHVAIGPLIEPRSAPCYACFRRRLLTHTAAPDREQVLERAYARAPGLGPAGFMPGMARMAAAALWGDAEDDGSSAGRFRIVDILNGQVDVTQVVSVHGCRRCLGPRSGSERFVNRIAPAIEEMLK